MPFSPNAVLTLSLQLLLALLTLAFGTLALRVAPQPAGNARLGAWYMTGATFGLDGAVAVLSAVLAVVAMFFPPGSAGATLWLWYQSIANDARAVLVVGFAAALGWTIVRHRPVPGARTMAVGLAAVLAVGSVLGVMEGAYQIERQFGVMSLVNSAAVVVLLGTLYLALVNNAMDWHLWLALAVHAVREATNTLVTAAVSIGILSRDWNPAPRSILWLGCIAMLAMIWCVLVRLGGVPGGDAPALMERLRG